MVDYLSLCELAKHSAIRGEVISMLRNERLLSCKGVANALCHGGVTTEGVNGIIEAAGKRTTNYAI